MANEAAPQDARTEALLEAGGRRRDREVTKQALLAAGLRVFAERGYDAATTREVAQAAGVNEQLIQRYFGGKEGLLVAIIERFGEEERRCCAMPPPCESLEAEIRGFLDFQLEHATTIGDFSKVALHRSLCDREVAREIGRQFAETRVPLLHQRLEALRERGLIDRDADLEAAATALSSLSFGLAFVDQVVFGADCERLRRVTRHVARVYAAGLAPRLTRGGAPR
ncbi:MAG TPA: helix-turn-helix domain-containing protein [Geminicoccaceae bacterium]|nr:helix-turn-helix domain-containing protein [Geminicoccaceae bacterium]